MKYEVRSRKNFEAAVDSLKASLSSNSFGILWELNFKDKLGEKGLEFNMNFKILEVCNPKQAKEVLDKNIEVGYFLPCKMVVYEKEGSVVMGMLNPTELIGMAVGDSEEYKRIAEHVEAVLKKSIDEAV